MGGLLGWLYFYFYGMVVSWTSEWFGRDIKRSTVITVLAYALIPLVSSLFILAIQILIYGNAVFQSEPLFEEDSAKFYLFLGLLALQILLGLYSFVLFVICLSEVGKISVGKAILNALSPLLILLAILAIAMGFNFVFKLF